MSIDEMIEKVKCLPEYGLTHCISLQDVLDVLTAAKTADQPVGKMLIADEKENVWHDDNGDIWEPIRARILERESGSHYRMALEHIREIWAGSECGEPKYAQEAYAINLCKEMYQEAVDALRNDIEGGKSNG